MSKRVKIHKNRIGTTICLTLLLMVVISFISFSSIASTTLMGFVRDCSNFDMVVEKITVLITQGIDDKGKTLRYYGDILIARDQWTDSSINEYLDSTKLDDEFLSLVFVKSDGTVVGNANGLLSSTKTAEILKNLSNQENEFYVTPGDGNSTVYAVPLSAHNTPKGTLVGLADANLRLENYEEDFGNKKSALYLLTPENQVMSFLGGDKKNFDYESIPKNHFFSASSDLETQTEMILTGMQSNHALLSTLETANLPQNFTPIQIEKFMTLLDGSTFLWYEKPAMINNESGWKVVIGMPAALSSESKLTIFNVGFLVAFVIVFFFFMTLILILSQGLSNRKLCKMAYLDFATGHSNWNRFELDVTKAFKRRKAKKYAMVTLDIRKFRAISDSSSYQNSDDILKAVSDVIKKQLNRKEFYTRVTVDEFALMLMDNGHEELNTRIRNMDTALKQTLTQLTFSYGIYYLEDYKLSLYRMYNYSYMAKYLVKKNPSAFIGIFTESLRENMLREQTLENNMDVALAAKEFHVYFQPKYSSDGQRVEGAEALVRWISPTLGFISPGAFIPLFEKNGFIIELDNYMLEEVAAYQKKWLDQGKSLVTISVNLSRLHLIDPQIVEHITAIVDKYQLPHHYIELELTESAFFDDKDMLLATVNGLRSNGFSVSMDDFGAGYSSLNSLKDLPLDVIKLDGEFFRETENKERSQTVIKDTISLARHLNMKIVAEGIETKEQVDFLHQMGCDLIQGYYFAKPMPSLEFEDLMGYSFTSTTEPQT